MTSDILGAPLTVADSQQSKKVHQIGLCGVWCQSRRQRRRQSDACCPPRSRASHCSLWPTSLRWNKQRWMCIDVSQTWIAAVDGSVVLREACHAQSWLSPSIGIQRNGWFSHFFILCWCVRGGDVSPHFSLLIFVLSQDINASAVVIEVDCCEMTICNTQLLASLYYWAETRV